VATISNKAVGAGAACAMLGVALAFATSSDSSSVPDAKKAPVVAPAAPQNASR
jgi:hypothetical protein